MSSEMQEVEEWAKEYDSKLRADDPRFARAVTFVHEEGTVLHYRFAFVLKKLVLMKEGKKRKKGWWYCIFTEHHRFHIYHETDGYPIQFSGEIPAEEVK